MTAEMAIILKQYDEHNMSIEDICAESDGEYEPTSIKAVLAQYSAKYRAAVRGDKGGSEDFTTDEAEIAKQAIVQIMQSTEDDYLRFRTAKYVRDDKKGRLDVDKMAGLKIDAMTFNFHIKQVSAARERTMRMSARSEATQLDGPSSSANLHDGKTIEVEKVA